MTVFLLFVSFLTEFSNFSEYFGIFVLWITVGKALWSQSILLLNMAVSLGQGIFLRECHGEAVWVDRLLSIRVLQTKSLSGGETGTEWSKIVTDILPFYKHTDLEIHREKDRNKKVSLIIQHHSLAPHLWELVWIDKSSWTENPYQTTGTLADSLAHYILLFSYNLCKISNFFLLKIKMK